jgi:hypothetical protein
MKIHSSLSLNPYFNGSRQQGLRLMHRIFSENLRGRAGDWHNSVLATHKYRQYIKKQRGQAFFFACPLFFYFRAGR